MPAQIPEGYNLVRTWTTDTGEVHAEIQRKGANIGEGIRTIVYSNPQQQERLGMVTGGSQSPEAGEDIRGSKFPSQIAIQQEYAKAKYKKIPQTSQAEKEKLKLQSRGSVDSNLFGGNQDKPAKEERKVIKDYIYKDGKKGLIVSSGKVFWFDTPTEKEERRTIQRQWEASRKDLAKTSYQLRQTESLFQKEIGRRAYKLKYSKNELEFEQGKADIEKAIGRRYSGYESAYKKMQRASLTKGAFRVNEYSKGSILNNSITLGMKAKETYFLTNKRISNKLSFMNKDISYLTKQYNEIYSRKKQAEKDVMFYGLEKRKYKKYSKEYSSMASKEQQAIGKYIYNTSGQYLLGTELGMKRDFRNKPLVTAGWFAASLTIYGATGKALPYLSKTYKTIKKPLSIGLTAEGTIVRRAIFTELETYGQKAISLGVGSLYVGSKYKQTKSLPDYERPMFIGGAISTELIPMMAGTYVGAKGYQIYKGYQTTKGMEYIPREKVTTPKVLEGKAQFPLAGKGTPKSIAKTHKILFEKGKYNLPQGELYTGSRYNKGMWEKISFKESPLKLEAGGYHATPESFSPKTLGEKIAVSSPKSPLHVSSSISKNFLGLDFSGVYGENIFPSLGSPEAMSLRPLAGKGYKIVIGTEINRAGYIYKNLKLVEVGRPLLPGTKREIQAVYEFGTEFELIGKSYYTSYGGFKIPYTNRYLLGTRIPITEYQVLPTTAKYVPAYGSDTIKKVSTPKNAKSIPTISSSAYQKQLLYPSQLASGTRFKEQYSKPKSKDYSSFVKSKSYSRAYSPSSSSSIVSKSSSKSISKSSVSPSSSYLTKPSSSSVKSSISGKSSYTSSGSSTRTPPSYTPYTPPSYTPYTPPPYTLPRFRLKQKPKRYKFKSKVQRGYKYTPSLYSRIFKIKFGTKLFKSRIEKTGLGLRPL
jgi:hypothetical protein